MNDPSHPRTELDRARLDAVLGPVVRAHGAEVVDVEWKTEQGGWILRIFLEKSGSAEAMASVADGAVSLEQCAGVSRDLSPALDVADIVPHRYVLEVSSPGLERTLRSLRDYTRFVGQKAKLRLHKPVDEQKVIIGVIDSCVDGSAPCVIVREGGRVHSVPHDLIAHGRLVFELAPAPKPGKGPKAKRRDDPGDGSPAKTKPNPKDSPDT
jgi:ribosome maturation factor RimP